MEPLKTINRITSKIARGPGISFSEVHVVKVLEVLGVEGARGRFKLSSDLGIGEGATRTLIKHLRREGLIETSKVGCKLTSIGKAVFNELTSKISKEVELPKNPLTIGPFNVAVIVRNSADAVKTGVEQRDAAIKVGASGATTFVFRNGELKMPSVNKNCFKDAPEIHDLLISKLQPKDKDVIIVGSADDIRTAEFGAKAAALEILKKLSEI
jgi:predicted transcriptional regulator